MRRKLNIKNNWEAYEYFLDEKPITIDELKKIEYLEDNEGYSYKIAKIEPKSVKYSDHGHTYSACRYVVYVETPFGLVEVNQKHYFYVEPKEPATLESVAEYWRGYFMEDGDEVNMTMKEHKQFAEECLEAGITALDVYKYLGV